MSWFTFPFGLVEILAYLRLRVIVTWVMNRQRPGFCLIRVFYVAKQKEGAGNPDNLTASGVVDRLVPFGKVSGLCCKIHHPRIQKPSIRKNGPEVG